MGLQKMRGNSAIISGSSVRYVSLCYGMIESFEKAPSLLLAHVIVIILDLYLDYYAQVYTRIYAAAQSTKGNFRVKAW